ncbi:hypothetical protein [Desertimonas flava]|uniref:hypothetical protein n=1 Tax=Desertimonas flava TaxID=2064846 RepID=UPI000E3422B3|nr:hypothetical protein [Desertimonas flava]
MTHPAMFVLAEAEPGRLGELARWYAERHLPEMLDVPGIASATQYRPVADPGAEAPASLLTIYRFDTDDAQDVIAQLAARRHEMSATTALAAATVWLGRDIPDDYNAAPRRGEHP